MRFRRQRKAGVAFVLVTLGIDSLGIGLVVPIVPELVRRLYGGPASGASLAVGALVATFALAQLIAAPILGALSDRFGRRPVILLSIAGVAANYILLAWAPTLGWLFLGRALAGITAANTSASTAYIADVSTPLERARRFGLVGATFSLGFVLGPALGGVLGDIQLRLPFIAAAALAGCNALFGLLVLPESLPLAGRQPFAWRGANPVSALRTLAADAVLSRLAVAWGCMWFALGTLQTVFVLSTAVRFGWTGTQNGAALALVGVTGALVQGVLVRRVVALVRERGAALVGFGFSIAAYTILGLAGRGWMIYAAIVVQAFGAIANPAVRAMVSMHVGPERQGRVMGSLSAVEGLTAIVSPLIASALFRVFSATSAPIYLPGAPFLATVLVYLVALAVIWRVRVTPVVAPLPEAPAIGD